LAGSHSVLVVDDEQSMREVLEIVLTNQGYRVKTAANIAQAVGHLENTAFDAVLTDLRIGSDHEAGMKLLSWLQEKMPATPAIMITAYGSVETAIEAMKRGAVDYILKPFNNQEIRMLLKRAIEERDLRRENTAMRKEQARQGRLDNFMGTSMAIEEVREMIRRVSSLPTTVAIHGESGTGKELVAKGIHQLSDRADKPFVAVNCGAFPENLLESELFGHKKGAFTGAVEDKEGLFVVANGGVLFLDEVGEMPPALQVKLLRVLDNNVIMPVGSTVEIHVDVRIISATNRDLERMVGEGDFREDLFYRLNVIPIYIPPLREHPDDVPLLARHFAAEHAAKMGREHITITPEAEEALCKYAWQGNVRELRNVMERTVALCSTQRLEMADLPPNVRNYVPPTDGHKTLLPPGGLDLEAHIADIERDLITQALKGSRYSQKKAARLLGLTPRSLRYRLQKYELDAP
jgi:two-component system, NtrC family, response regulator PilR